MNDVLLKGALRMLKSFISPEQMKQMALSLLKLAIDYKNSIPLDVSTGETQVAAIAWEHNEVIFTSVVFLNSEDTIIRYDQVKRADELIETLISKL
jgi:hypothetical protein